MSKAKKIIIALVSALILLPILLIILLVTIVNPNQYKEKLTDIASYKLNRQIQINGDLSWSLFPLGITLHDLKISNDPKFKAPYFLTSKNTTISLKILPLLSKRYEIDALHIENANINLARKDGYTNWQSMLSPADEKIVEKNKDVAENIKEAITEDDDSAASQKLANQGYFQIPDLPNVSIDKIKIIDSSISWTDGDNNITVDNINLTSDNFSLADNANFRLHGSLRSHIKAKDLSMFNELNIQVSLKNNKEKVILDVTNFSAELGGKAYPKHPYFKINGVVEGDLPKNHFKIYDLDGDLNNLLISGQLEGEVNDKARSLNGYLKLDNSNLGNFLDTLNYQHTSNHYQYASGEIKFSSKNEFITLDPIKLSLDSDNITGTVTIDANQTPFVITSNLTAEHLNLNKILLDKTPKAKKSPTEIKAEASKTPPPVTVLITDDIKTLLKNLNVTANTKVNKLIAQNLTINNLVNSAVIKNNNINSKTTLDLYQGKANIVANINANSATPSYNGKLSLTNFKAESLLGETLDIHQLSGNANFNFDYTSSGNTSNDLIRNLKGKFNGNLTNGTLKGIDLDKLVNLLNTKISLNPADILDTAKSTATFTLAVFNTLISNVSGDNYATSIVTVTGSGAINNGVVTNNDLKLQTKLIEVNGTGNLDILNDKISYAVKIHDIHDPNDIAKLEIPVQFYGRLSDPKYSVGVPTGAIITKTFKKLDKLLKKVPILDKIPLDQLPIEQIDKLLSF